jgi:hypothetical protein
MKLRRDTLLKTEQKEKKRKRKNKRKETLPEAFTDCLLFPSW